MKIIKKNKIVDPEAVAVHREIVGMARIGWVPPTSPYSIEVYVNTDDKSFKPHFHVRKYGKNHKFEWETCLLFEKAEYFLHGKHKAKLPNSKFATELDSMLRTTDTKSRHNLTYWEEAIDEWNKNNSSVQLDLNLQQPDYTKL